MASDHNSLPGAGNRYSPAPSLPKALPKALPGALPNPLPKPLPVYAICDLCGEAEEAEKICPYATGFFTAHLCPECLAAAEREYRQALQEEAGKPQRLSQMAMLCVVVWVAAVVWRWWR